MDLRHSRKKSFDLFPNGAHGSFDLLESGLTGNRSPAECLAVCSQRCRSLQHMLQGLKLRPTRSKARHTGGSLVIWATVSLCLFVLLFSFMRVPCKIEVPRGGPPGHFLLSQFARCALILVGCWAFLMRSQ